MVNQFKSVLDWKQKTKLFGVARSAYDKKTWANLDCLAMESIEDCEIKAEQEKARATTVLLRQASIIQ